MIPLTLFIHRLYYFLWSRVQRVPAHYASYSLVKIRSEWNPTKKVKSCRNLNRAMSDEESSSSSLLIQVSETLPSLEYVHDFLSSSSPGCGAVSVFVGITRNNFEGKVVANLEYEGYTPMAMRELHAICRDARAMYPGVERLVAAHLLGDCPVGGASVVVGCNSPHRKEAMRCTEYLIDELKARVPIWKKEIYEGDEKSVWKENVEWREGRRRRVMVKENALL
jgi:molybdopterin synthase catalytic subunit